jgi:uncharacterized protein YjbI with pentapeptide repeats
VVVVALDQGLSGNVVDALVLRRVELDVVGATGGEVDPAPTHAVDYLLVVDVDLDHCVECYAHGAERFGLCQRAREAVEQKAVLAVVLRYALVDKPHYDVVGHQATGIHDLLGLLAQRGPLLDRGPEHVAGGYLRDAILVLDVVGLGALACPRRPQQDDFHANYLRIRQRGTAIMPQTGVLRSTRSRPSRKGYADPPPSPFRARLHPPKPRFPGLISAVLALLLVWPHGPARAACEDPPGRGVFWIRCDLQNADLRGVDLRRATLSRADLRGADLREANLSGADLEFARLDGARLDRAVMIESRLVSASLREVSAAGTLLDGARLDRAVLDAARFEGSSLRGATLYQVSAKQTDFTGARLTGASIERARLEGAILEDADLDDLQASRASLEDARLGRASLVRARLDGADLSFADLEGADLTRANLSGAQLRGTRFDDALFGNATWTDRRRCRPGSVGACD